MNQVTYLQQGSTLSCAFDFIIESKNSLNNHQIYYKRQMCMCVPSYCVRRKETDCRFISPFIHSFASSIHTWCVCVMPLTWVNNILTLNKSYYSAIDRIFLPLYFYLCSIYTYIHRYRLTYLSMQNFLVYFKSLIVVRSFLMVSGVCICVCLVPKIHSLIIHL